MADLTTLRSRIDNLRLQLPDLPDSPPMAPAHSHSLDQRLSILSDWRSPRFVPEGREPDDTVEPGREADGGSTPAQPAVPPGRPAECNLDNLSAGCRGLYEGFQQRIATLKALDGVSGVQTGFGPPRKIATSTYRAQAQWAIAELCRVSQEPFDQLADGATLERCLSEFRDDLDRRIHDFREFDRLRKFRDEFLGKLRLVQQQLAADELGDLDDLTDLAATLIEQRRHDQALFVSTAPAEAIDVMIAEHALNTASVALFLANDRLDDGGYVLSLTIAALVQDVGMLDYPRSYWKRTLPLSMKQRRDLWGHPETAAAFLERCDRFDPRWIAAVRDHHERLDGSGYPDRKDEGSLSTEARLLAIADVYSALRCPRFHRPGQSPRTALTQILNEVEAGRLDRSWAVKLLDVSLYPVGTMVELATGEIAEVIATHRADENPRLAALPVVRILRDPAGNVAGNHEYRNLAQHPQSRIVLELPSV